MEKNIYIKITSIPNTEDIKVDSQEFALFKNKYGKDFNTNTPLTEAETYQKYYKESSKNPLFAKIYSITIAYCKEDGVISTLVLKGGEKEIIQRFLNLYNEDRFKGFKTVVWNADFSLPFITTRASKNGILSDYPKDLQHFGKKPWSLTCLDLQSYLKGCSWFSNSLAEWAYIYNLPADFVDGEDVYTTYKSEGGENELDRSSINEIIAMVNIHRKAEGEQPLKEVVSNVVELEGEVAAIELPLLQKIALVKKITRESKETFKKIFDKKKGSEKDKEIILNLIRASLAEIDPNFGKVINQKEIDQIIEQLKEELWKK